MKYYKDTQDEKVYGYDPETQQDLIDEAIEKGWVDITGSWPPPVDWASSNKGKASSLLSATDWVNQPDVIDTSRTPHLLNQSDFLAYRSLVRQIAVNPPATEVTDWPVLPTEHWGQ